MQSESAPTHDLNIIVLNSGSNGNAVYVESHKSGTAVLLDCGISRTKIESRLKVHGRYLNSVKAVFITHEHRDHIHGLDVVSKIYRPKIYLTERTYKNIRNRRSVSEFHFLTHIDTVHINDLTVDVFPKNHDAADPIFLQVTSGKKRFLYATDLGTHNEHLLRLLPHADAIMMESNYDHEMLINGGYPEVLKQRILSDNGHLSNAHAMGLIERHCDGKLQTLILGHLSENNNNPEIVRQEVEALVARKKNFTPKIHIASRHDVSEVMEI